MPRVDTLPVNVWETTFASEDHVSVTRYAIAATTQETLTQWSRQKAGRSQDEPMSIILRGLSEITSWFVPEVAFVRREWDATVQRERLCFYFIGEMAGNLGLRQRMQSALQLWLNILYPDKPATQRAELAASALVDTGWTVIAVSCALKPQTGACPDATDGLFWDALTAHAADRLAGQALRFASGESRILVPSTAQHSTYGGRELVAFPPKRGNEKGLWSEVITLHAATFPERSGIHILARPSIRNWGSIMRSTPKDGPRRSLDVFLPAEEAFGHATRRHTSFAFRARRAAPAKDGTLQPLTGYWGHKDDQKIFDLLRRLTNQSALGAEELTAPLIDQDGLWILPRLGSGHGDRYLSGGSGIAWPDRKDIGDSLETMLGGAGFARAAPLVRRSLQQKISKTFTKEDDAPARRALREALAANDGQKALTFYVFHLREATPQRVIEHLIQRFGTPGSQVDGVMRWADGLVIEVRSAPSGVLSDALPLPELTPEESQGRNAAQLKSLRGLKRDQAREDVERQMAAHIKAVRGPDDGLACAIVEMPAALRDTPRQDPFQLTRRELARRDILPQVVLVETKSHAESTDAGGGKAGSPKDDEKYAAAMRDCLRMLGALPLELLPDALAPAALTIVQRNAERLALGSRPSQAIPLAIRVSGAVLECATPDENGTPRWAPYPQAMLRVLRGEYLKFGRGKQADNIARFGEFFASVLDDINRAGPALVIAEGESIRHKIDGFTNKALTFDALQLGDTIVTPASLPNLRLVRVSPDPKRQPFYYHESDNKWPSGLFEWEGATRTFYALKAKPATVSTKQHFAAMTSRHGDEGSNVKVMQIDTDRVSAQLDEICVILHQPDDKPAELANLTHRLRGAHVQTGVDTASPFPLHELRLLAGGITF